MKITVTDVVPQIDGLTPFRVASAEGKEEVATLGSIMAAALLGAPAANGTEKFARFSLALRIYTASQDSGAVDLTIEEVGLIKKVVGESFSTAISGRVWMMLETAADAGRKATQKI